MRTLILLCLALPLISATCSTDGDCGPFPERHDAIGMDTVAMRWARPALLLRSRLGEKLGEILRWEHADSISVIATHRMNTSADSLRFEHRVYADTVVYFEVSAIAITQEMPGASIDCTPAPDPSGETEFTVFAPETMEVRISYY